MHSEKQTSRNNDEEQLMLVLRSFMSPMALLRKMVRGHNIAEISRELCET